MSWFQCPQATGDAGAVHEQMFFTAIFAASLNALVLYIYCKAVVKDYFE